MNEIRRHADHDPELICRPAGHGLCELAPAGILLYDLALPEPPDPTGYYWTPFRGFTPRTTRCYELASGARVHVKPGCRCKP
ncbi:MAG: hypothetical protein KGJ86_09205 [Chloroflexota bacterium]|nr:hypothetical protein [Chloroflexota bacterium]